MDKTRWIIFSAAVVLLIGGLVAYTRITNPPLDVSNVNVNSVLAAAPESGDIADHTKGQTDGKILLVEYGDFQCPSCGGAHPNVNALMEEYGDSVTFVYRNFPLTTIHPNARAAAAVAEAAGLQGKYWEMYDLLFESQNSWSSLDASQRTGVFNGYAQSLDLDLDRFTTDIAASNVSKKINFDQAVGKKAGAEATPSFYLNGEKLDDATANGIVQGNLSAIKTQLDALIKE